MADAVGDLTVVSAGGIEDVAVARAVDDLLGEDRLLALLGLEDDAHDLVALLDDVHAPAVEEHVDLLLGDHHVHQVLRALGVDRRLPVDLLNLLRTRLADIAAQGNRAIGELLRETARDQAPALAFETLRGAEHDQDHAVGEESAQRAIALDKGDLRTRAGGGNRGGESGGATANHDDVRLVENRNLPCGADDLAILHLTAGTILDRVAEREDVLAEPDVVRITHRTRRQGVLRLHKLVCRERRAHKGRATDAKTLQKLSLADVHGVGS